MFYWFREKLKAWNDLSLYFTLIGASMDGRANIVRKILSRGISVNASRDGLTPLLGAVKHTGDIETILVLLDQGADIHVKDKHGKTAITIAEEKGRSDLVEILKAATPI